VPEKYEALKEMMPMKEGLVVGVCVSEKRGTGKVNVGKGYLAKDYGLIGDAHAGSERPLSILPLELIERVASEKEIKANPGDFAENVTVKGIDMKGIRPGTRMSIGEAEVEVIQIGKEIDASHTFSFHGIALLVSEGCFCRVVRSGRVKIGDSVRLLEDV
jgi:MOSC domain-containing protein YiiM